MNNNSSKSPMKDNVIAVVVLFRPDGDLQFRLNVVMEQVVKLIAVGNDQLGGERLDGLLGDKCEYIENNINAGLGTALNQGLRRARELHAEWCLLLDQDTLVDQDLVEGLRSVHDDYSIPSSIAILAPNYRSNGGLRIAYPEKAHFQEMRTVVTSGSLVSLDAVATCGGMKENFFIEGIDLEFALRVRRAGWVVVASGKPLMTHGAGADEERRFLWRTVQVGHHSPERCFLQVRNLVWTMREYWVFDKTWVVTSILALLKRLLLTISFEKNRGAKITAMLKGGAEGLVRRGKVGSI